MSTELPPLESFVEKCGKGTAWIGEMIREQMRTYGQQCRDTALLEAAALTAERDMWHKIADERAAEIVRLHQDKAKVAKLDAILAEYRNGTRDFPMYAELSALLRG